MDAMNKAWEYLMSLDAGDRYFVKILFTKDETAALNRNNFSLLATAAVAAVANRDTQHAVLSWWQYCWHYRCNH
jgi:hypothetical protein